MTRSLRSRVLLSLGITVALSVAGIFGLGLVSKNARESQHLVNHTLDVIASVEHLGRLGFDAQAAMRGYLLLGDNELLERFTARSAAFREAADALADLVRDNPTQAERARRIKELHYSWETTLRPLVARRATITDEDRSVLREGARLMDALTAVIGEVTQIERDLLRVRRGDSSTAAAWMMAAAILVIVIAVLVACGTAFSLAFRVARDARRLADAASAIAEGDLTRRIDIGRKDELAAVGNAFNLMAVRLARSNDDEEALARLREMLQASQTSAEAHTVLERLAPPCLPVAAARVYVITASRNHLAPTVSWGTLDQLPPGDGFAPDQCWALRSGRPHVVADSTRDMVCAHRTDVDGPSVCMPLVAQGESVGLLYLADSALPASSEEVGEMIGLTLANLRLRDVLRNQAIRDPLTGLYNRRYLEETLIRELSRVRRKKAPLAVIVIDVDHFKRFNDTYGHHGGDVMLREVASVMTKSFRDSDIICRFGGEEFVIIAPECALDMAVSRTDELRARMRASTVTIDARTVPGPTISAGIAIFPDHGDSPDQLFQVADRAVYRSKSEGRDRTTVASGAT